jgi:hypothetical protein
MPPSLATRVSRMAVPSLVAAAGTFGIALALQPQPSVEAVPAPVVSTSPVADAPSMPATSPSASSALAHRGERGSRGRTGARPARRAISPRSTKSELKAELVPRLTVIGTRYATVDLLLRVEASQKSKTIGVARVGAKLKVTDTVRDGFRFIAYAGKGRWVKNQYLSTKRPDTKRPDTAAGGGISSAACKTGSAVESGLTPDAIRVHRAICARYPQVTAFGGRRSSNDFHGSGQALDSMISNSTVGWEIARWVRAHAKQLGVSEVIYSQRIWTVQRGSEGWRSMSDRGSPTANHYDHVHVSVYGSRGTA